MVKINDSLLKSPELHEVEISSLVLLKILKHCKDYFSAPVTGQLLGIDVSGSLKVTNCFPFAKPQEAQDDTNEAAGVSYQLDMYRFLRNCDYENNAVGWYQATHFGAYWSQSLIETQFNYQTSFPRSVLIVCDFTRGTKESVCIKAMRLSSNFMKLFSNSLTSINQVISGQSFDSVFEQVPVKVKSLHLAANFLNELNIPEVPSVPIGVPIGGVFEKKNNSLKKFSLSEDIEAAQVLSHNIDILGPEHEESLEKNIEYISEVLEEYTNEVWRWHCWQRALTREQQHIMQNSDSRYGMNNNTPDLLSMPFASIQQHYPALAKLIASEPGKIETLVISNQASTCCKQISQVSGELLTKLYMSFDLISQNINPTTSISK